MGEDECRVETEKGEEGLGAGPRVSNSKDGKEDMGEELAEALGD